MSNVFNKYGINAGAEWTMPSNVLHGYYGESNANDSIGSQNGSVSGNTYVAGKVGNCFSFAGAGYMAAGLPTDFNRASKTGVGCAYECWASFAAWGAGVGSTAARAISDENGWKAMIMSTGSGVVSGVKNNGTYVEIQKTGLSLNTWYHFVMNINSDYSWEFFVDSVSAGTNADTTIPLNHSNGMNLGVGITGSLYGPLNGKVDQGRFYLGPLTQTQITDLYNGGNGR